MKTIDTTKSISKYFVEKNTNFVDGGVMGTYGWCRFMKVTDGTMETYKTLFRRREVSVPHIVAEFEIWSEKTIALPKEVWNDIYPKIKLLVKNFEKETGQAITIKKINEPTKWADY